MAQMGELAESVKYKTKPSALRAAVRYLEDGYIVRMLHQFKGPWIVFAYYDI